MMAEVAKKRGLALLGLVVGLVIGLATVAYAAPSNDAFATADGGKIANLAAYSGGRSVGSFVGSTEGATTEAGEPFIGTGETIWYKFTSPVNGSMQLTCPEQDFDFPEGKWIRVYTGQPVDALSLVSSKGGCEPPVGTRPFSFEARKGFSYLIQVDPQSEFEIPGFRLDYLWSVGERSDDLADADPFEFVGGASQLVATQEPGEPFAVNTAWYDWTAPFSGEVSMETCVPAGHFNGLRPADTQLGVYTGSEVGSLVAVAQPGGTPGQSDDSCSDDAGGDTASRVTFTANQGTTYHVQYGVKNAGEEDPSLPRHVINAFPVTMQVEENHAPAGSVKINGGATKTKKAKVQLSLAANDAQPSSGIDLVRFSNDNRKWSQWFGVDGPRASLERVEPWTLSRGAGTKTVYVQYKDRNGNVSTAKDTIKYAS